MSGVTEATPSATPEPPRPARAWAVGFEERGGDLFPAIDVVLRSEDGGASWAIVLRSALGLGALDFVDRDHGWVLSEAGSVLETEDGGATWLSVKPFANGAEVAFAALAFTDRQNGVVTGAVLEPERESVVRPILVRTRDGGASWSEATIIPNGNAALVRAAIQHICFTPSGIGMAVGTGDVAPGTFEVGTQGLVVLVSDQDGTSWTDVTARLGLGLPSGAIITAIACVADDLLWLAGIRAPRLHRPDEPIHLVSLDGGGAWRERSFESEFPPSTAFVVGGFAFADRDAGWALTAPFASFEPVRLFHTGDGGASWRQQARPLLEAGIPLTSISMADARRGVIVGIDDTSPFGIRTRRAFAWFTEDGGQTPWRSGRLPDGVSWIQHVSAVP